MEYITAREAAQRWKISERLAQQYCTEGRIQGAVKFGNAWAIPADALKPTESSQKKRPPVTAPSPKPVSAPPLQPLTPMPLMNTAFVPGHCVEYVESIQDPRIQDIARAEYYYFSGQAEEASQLAELYLSHPEVSLRLSACLIYAYANLTLGQIPRARQALSGVRNILAAADANTPPQLRASAACIVIAAAVLLHLLPPESIGSLQDHVRLLPPGLRMFALYVEAHRTYLQGDYSKSIGIVETTFAMQTEIFPIPSIYMHLVAVMDYMSLKQPEQAQKHLLEAWELARPDDLIEGFGEHHGLLGGMLEAVLKKDWPEDFKRIISITYRFSAGWRKVHNPDSGHDVADNLTTTEFATAMLAARGWTNQEIADHMGISPNTVKQYISVTLQKLNIKQRKDLGQYMLR